jgi:hypothetical protein
MRRAVLWIIVIMTTFMIGIGIDRAVEYFVVSELPAPADPQPVAVYFPDTRNEIVTTLAKPNLILDFDPEKFSPSGYLEIMKPAPQDFKDLEYIALELYKGENGESPVNIYVSIGKALDHHELASADFALVTEQTLYFTTAPSDLNGFQYKFDGEFLVRDFESVAGKNIATVRGKLTKSKKGRVLAEHEVILGFYLGC